MRTFKQLFATVRERANGDQRKAMRDFNFSQRLDGKAKSVKELAENLGFSVTLVSLRRGISGRLVQDPFSDNGYEIQVNKNQSKEAMRWTVLHEMGHFFLHSDRSDPLADPLYLDRSDEAFYVDQKQEAEANHFAAVLLFGDGSLEAAVSLHGKDIRKLARVFGVSEKTIEIALKQFL
ncbi:ImmA/IrrE family metallo-endopeptidase [Cognatishimia sp. MH4019]|uniref:ImmA/IrrE family metallo-endopeptidase n=1 Tax=Cognatishimia sp. MH4019 TaxID=2854030 RepID=UPI001CD76B98|nr:ImmA/IrrE family metallo-endopeptidase [Cognatishimia sp. MH4019]